MRVYKKLKEITRNEYIVSVHVTDDCKPETLQALGEMMKLLIEQVESGGLTPRAADGEQPVRLNYTINDDDVKRTEELFLPHR